MKAIHIQDFNQNKTKEDVIIKRIIEGEKELYEILVRRHNQKLYRIIRSYLKEEAEIEDIMQNTYLKAFSKLYQFKLESSFSTWLIRIGINESLAYLNKKGRLVHLNKASNSLRSNSILEIQDYKQLNPQDRMIQMESKQLLENAIDQLTPKYKTVYILRELEEMSLKEIAIALDLTVANVKIRLHRSKVMLKDILYNVTNDKNIFEFGFSRCDRITEHVMNHI